jgi:hypothetical protein
MISFVNGSVSYNRGEWSELYAFLRLLQQGKIYAADENTKKINKLFYPIVKLYRKEKSNPEREYICGSVIEVSENGKVVASVSNDELDKNANILLNDIFKGVTKSGGSQTFAVSWIWPFLDSIKITQVKAPSLEKADISMLLHDPNTGYNPKVGFSVKSDIGSAPTLLNPGKNTKIRYEIKGITKEKADQINSITKASGHRNYIKDRMALLFQPGITVSFDRVLDETFRQNLIMIDSLMPEILGELILLHYSEMNSSGVAKSDDLCNKLAQKNPLSFSRTDVYRFKYKKLITAVALGMTPGHVWDGQDQANGGYIVIKKNGEILCYFLYNRNFFEEYLIKNTQIDRPSPTRYDFGYIYQKDGHFYIEFNYQVRFVE